MNAEEIARGLSEAQRRSVTAFAPAFSSRSEAGMLREWADICFMAGPRRSFYNTIRPLIERGLAERTCDGFCRLTLSGLAVRDVLMKEKG